MTKNSGGAATGNLRRNRKTIGLALLLLLGGSLWAAAEAPTDGLSRWFGSRRWKALGGVNAPGYHVIDQRSMWDCGYAALATLVVPEARARAVFDSLVKAVPPPPGGVTVGDLEHISAQLGLPLVGHPVQGLSWLEPPPPYLVLLSEHHFVTVIAGSQDMVVIADPAAGVFALTHDHLALLHPIAVLTNR